MESVNDQEFVKKFDDFYLELTTLNYIFRTKFKALNERQLKSIEYLKLLIPIFKRLQEEGDNLEINQVLQEQNFKLQEHNFPDVPKTTPSAPQYSPDMPYQQPSNTMYYPSAPVIRIPIDTDSDGYNNVSESEETSEDKEGDEKVNKLTDDVLELLSNIQKNSWAIVEPESDNLEVNDNGDDGNSTEEDTEDAEDENEFQELNVAKDEMDSVPLLVNAN